MKAGCLPGVLRPGERAQTPLEVLAAPHRAVRMDAEFHGTGFRSVQDQPVIFVHLYERGRRGAACRQFHFTIAVTHEPELERQPAIAIVGRLPRLLAESGGVVGALVTGFPESRQGCHDPDRRELMRRAGHIKQAEAGLIRKGLCQLRPAQL